MKILGVIVFEVYEKLQDSLYYKYDFWDFVSKSLNFIGDTAASE